MASTHPIQISHNCKQVLLNIPMPNQAPGSYTLDVVSATTSISYPVTLIEGQAAIVFNINYETSGVVEATVKNTDGVVITRVFTVSTCKIDCCIAALVESAIKCTCKCDKCKEELDRAEKIFLLLQSAVYAAEVAENIQDATDKYNKANEMCTEVCACGC